MLADDHAIVRQGLKLLLQSQSGYRVVAEVATLDRVQPALQEQAVDLLILDYHMPPGESSAVLAWCKQRYPELKIIALTGAQSGVILKQLRDARADAVMLKDSSGPELLRCIEQVMAGEQVLPDAVREQIDACDSDLTPREQQILQLIYQGLATAEIAEQLSLSAKTVDKHRENLMRKLQVNNVVQLIHKVQLLKLC
ncbi:MAG: response regulator transcription factor [Pseudomonadota bacterium]